jgi:hypothetical protein
VSARRELYARVEILVAIHKGTPMQLTRLVYASYHGGTTVKALGDILDQSQANNEVDGITGILVASDEDFMQFLEGGRTVVAECMMRIMKDERHQNIRILLAREAETRLFSGWSMRGIDASQLNQRVRDRYWTCGAFGPGYLSHAEIEELCIALSKTP